MQSTKQTFPAVTITPMESGLIRVEDETYIDGSPVDLHPLHVQVMSTMIGRPVPDRTRACIAKIQGRVEALHRQATEMADLLNSALMGGENIACELTHAENIAERLGEIAEDLDEMAAAAEIGEPADEIDAGGQLTIAL